MKSKSVLSLIIIAFALTNCNQPKENQFENILNQNTSIQSINSNFENLVNKSRIQKYLAVFSGKDKFNESQKISERGTKTGRTLTRSYLKSVLGKMDYKVEEKNYKRGFSYRGANIVTTLKANIETDEYILVGAHMDSVKNPGADDNASGSSAVLEAATVLKNVPNRKVNIIFAWFDQEELGLIGSKALADEYKKKGLNISSVHIVDMLGWDSDGDRTIEMARPGGFLWDYYSMVNKKHNINLPLFRTSLDRSDHYSFEQKGFDSVLLIEEYVNQDFSKFYHKQSDTYDKINFDYLTLGTKLLVAVVSDLTLQANKLESFKFVSHDQFPTRKGFCGDDHEFHSHLPESEK